MKRSREKDIRLRNHIAIIGASRGVEAMLRRIIEALCTECGQSAISLEVYVAREALLRTLKSKFYDVQDLHKKIDVLAFPFQREFPHPDMPQRPLGEIYINSHIIKKDLAQGKRLLIHGFLHLLHYDHNTKHDMLEMIRIEKKLWQRVLLLG